MNNTIIAIYGRAREGKSETIKNTCRLLLQRFPNAVTSIPRNEIDYTGDIFFTVQIGLIKIGFESQGDPGSRMITEDTIRQLADISVNSTLGGCQIIICATRTAKGTVQRVDQIASNYDYYTLWKSSYYSADLDHNVLNNLAAEEVVELINLLMMDRL